MAASSTPRPSRGWLRRAARVCLWALLALASLLAAGVASVNLPWVRQRICRELSTRISAPLAGSIEITGLDHIGWGSVRGARGQVRGPSGPPLARISGLDVSVDLGALVLSWLRDGPLQLNIEQLRIAELQLDLRRTETGQPALLAAFAPSAARASDEAGTSGAGALQLELADITLGHARVTALLSEAGSAVVELEDLHGQAAMSERSWTASVESVQVRAHELPVAGEVTGAFSGSLVLPRGAPDALDGLDANARWQGLVAGIPVRATLADRRGSISGQLEARLSGAPLHRLLPEAAPDAAATMRADLEGTSQQLALRAVVDSAGGELQATATLSLSPALSLELTGDAAQIDLAQWVAGAPQSSLRAAFTAHLEHSSPWSALQLELHSEDSEIAGQPLPELRVSARLEDTAAGQQLALTLEGGGASIQSGVVRLLPAEQPPELVGWLHASLEQLGTWSSGWGLDLPLTGRATLDASALVELGLTPSISGHVSADLAGLETGAASLARSSLQLSAAGPLTRPVVDFFLVASHLQVQAYHVVRLRLAGRGGLDQLRLRGAAQPRAAAALRFAAHVRPLQRSASGIRIRAGSADRPALISARRVTLRSGGFAVSGLELRGPGSLSADGSLQQGRLHLRARSSRFSPARFLRRLGYEQPVPEGVADLSLRLDYRRGTYSGRIDGVAREIAWEGVKGLTLAAHLGARERELDGQLALRAPALGAVVLEARALKLPGHWDRASLLQMPGAVDLIAHANLRALAALPGATSLTRWGASGKADARLHWAASGAAPPTLTMALSTRDLAWSLPGACAGTSAGEPCHAPASFQWQGMNVRVVLQSSGGQLRGSGSIVDPQGLAILKLRAETAEGLLALLRAGAPFDVRGLPLELHAEVPERRLADFPESLRFEKVDGRLSATATLTGTLGRPDLRTQAQLLGLQLDGSQESQLDARAELRLAGETMALSARVTRGAQELLGLTGRAALGGAGEEPRVRQLELELHGAGLPLEPFGALLGRELSGRVYGSASVSNRAGAPELRGSLRIEQPAFEGFRQQRALWEARADASSWSSELVLEQLAGRARVTASGPWRWSGSFTPSLALSQLQASIHTQHFELATIEPFLPDAARGIGGQLDADLRLAPPEASARASGKVRWTDGSIYVAGLGQRFHDITLDAQLAPSGRLVLEHLGARAALGRLEASGEAQLDGWNLRSAQLELLIPQRDPFPITVQGVTVATASGNARLEAYGGSSAEQALPARLKVSVPSLRVTLPREAPPDVQELAPDPTIHKGTYLEPDRFVSLPLPPYVSPRPQRSAARPAPSARVEVEVGDDVWVERGTTLKVKVTGDLSLELGAETTASGQLRLPRGVIDVQGREFQLERGELTFLKDQPPSNPTVVASAVYEAPQGTRVYAEFVGPVKTGHLTLRSEPPLRDDQILSLLLFGSPDGSFGASTGGSLSESALAAGGSLLTQGLNAELRRLTSLDIQTRIGERAGEPQPEVLVQVTPRLSAELAYLVESPEPGQSQDRTQLSLDLRLFRNWSLSTTIGDAGTLIVDLLWRYRY